MKSLRAMTLDTVDYVFQDAILDYEKFKEKDEEAHYVGVKNTNVIPLSLLQTIAKKAYIIHTIDKASHSGRAIDLSVKNPITGRHMTGSSSATAVNVFLNVNDLGIGTDGGGSVINPSIALNLYSIMSPMIYHDELANFSKESTDQIRFQPSLGFIAKDLGLIQKILFDLDYLSTSIDKELIVEKAKALNDEHRVLSERLNDIPETRLNYFQTERRDLMRDLENFDFENKILITYEGPTDYYSYGDSVMGHYDENTKERQNKSRKHYSKIVNMLGLSAITVPSQELSRAYLIIFKSERPYLKAALDFAKTIDFNRSQLEEDYFSLERGIRKDEFIKRWFYPHS